MTPRRFALLIVFVIASGCVEPPTPFGQACGANDGEDCPAGYRCAAFAGAAAGEGACVPGAADAGDSDAGDSDAGDSDAGDSDAGDSDAGPSDAGFSDGGLPDGGSGDAGSDGGPADAGGLRLQLTPRAGGARQSSLSFRLELTVLGAPTTERTSTSHRLRLSVLDGFAL